MSDMGLVKSNPAAYRAPPEPIAPVPIGEVRKFVPFADIDEWLLSRLDNRWPGGREAAWRSRIVSWAGSNNFFFVTNERCVLLLHVLGAHVITGKPVVVEVFAFCRDARWSEDSVNWVIDQKSEGAAAMAAVYRAGRDWMKGMNAARLWAGTCSDMSPSLIKHAVGGYYIMDVPNK